MSECKEGVEGGRGLILWIFCWCEGVLGILSLRIRSMHRSRSDSYAYMKITV